MRRILDLSREISRNPDRAESLLERFVRETSFPIVEDHEATFFFWDGKPAESVFLQHWVFGLASRVEFRKIRHTNAFYLPLTLPRNARVEYKFEVMRDGQGHWTRDPRNKHLAFDPFGSNSVCRAPSYVEPEWTHEDKASRRGDLREFSFKSAVYDEERSFKVYIPAEFRPGKRYPLLMVHDGNDFLHYAGMRAVLDNLIHRHEVAPMLACFTSGHARNREYAANPTQAEYLKEELLPWLERHLPLLRGAEHRGLMGASFGAVSSLYAAHRYPGTWGRLLLQSGSFAFTDIGEHERGPLWDPVVQFVNQLRESAPRIPSRVYLSCGTFESLIYYNRSLYPFFQEQAEDVLYTEAPDGHNWINWRDRLREGLSYLFPGPLWMYYE